MKRSENEVISGLTNKLTLGQGCCTLNKIQTIHAIIYYMLHFINHSEYRNTLTFINNTEIINMS